MGYFDENGRYCEVRNDKVFLKNLPETAIRKVMEGHDILIQVLPKIDIVVFAKNAHDLERYLETMGTDHVKDLLVAMSKYNNPEDGSQWATYDFPVEI
jgi:hypothetical protein